MSDQISSNTILAPVQPGERIDSLDVARGFALLGILVMNIQNFSMIGAAYINPAAYGDLMGINKWVWILSHVFFDSKFITIFSALFGAGIILFAERAMAKGRKPAGLHYRRIFWLLVIALIHAYFFWYGDILYAYAMCAIIVFLFRKMKPGLLLFFGFLAMMVPFLIYMMSGFTIEYWDEAQYEGGLQNWLPSAEAIQQELEAYRGGWVERMQVRAEDSIFMQTFLFLMLNSWHSGGIMLMGMALFKWGFLSAKLSSKTYVITMLAGFLLGLPLVIMGVVKNFEHEWFYDYSMWIGPQFNYWGSLGMSLAYLSILMLILKSGIFKTCTRTLALVGRAALSNYLLQTLIATFIFYGGGLGLIGKVARWQQLLFVLGIWLIQILLTRLWMKKYRFGPAEWAWRSLTYWKIQSIRYD